MLLPIVKVYTFDQAWRVTETAIQTMGRNDYLRDYFAEQNVRDCLADVALIWQLLEAALAAQRGLAAGENEADTVCYQQKIAAAHYFVQRRLPQAVALLENVQRGLGKASAQKLAQKTATNAATDMAWHLIEK